MVCAHSLAETLLVVLLPPLMGLEPNYCDLEAGFWAAPSGTHWLGTDDVGRDLFARLVCGGRISLLVGFAAAGLSVAVGVPLGLIAGYRRGTWEFWIMRLADLFQTFPSIVLVLCLVALVGPSVVNLILVIGLLGWTGIARLVYGNTLAVRETEHIVAHYRRWAEARPRFCGATCCPTRSPGVGSAAPAGGPGHPVRIQPELPGGRDPHAPGLLGQPDPVCLRLVGAHRTAVGMAAAGAVHRSDGALPSVCGGWSAGRHGSQLQIYFALKL